jgi:hypothetical protein
VPQVVEPEPVEARPLPQLVPAPRSVCDSWLVAKEHLEAGMAVMFIARFDGDVGQLRQAYDRAHALIMSRGGATGAGELRHHCAIGDRALYIIGVWESEERVRTRWASGEFEDVLTSVGFPSPKTADITILELHATEPPL